MSRPSTKDDVGDRFDRATEKVKDLMTRPTDGELLDLYGLYKQAMEGNNDNGEPWAIQVTAHRKWVAWTNCHGVAPEKAARLYSEYVDNLIGKYGIDTYVSF